MENQSSQRKKLIMIVDDSADLLKLYERILTSEGYVVSALVSGRDALATLGETQPPDLILLDFQMKTMNGAEFLLELENQFPSIVRDVPIVFISGMAHLPPSKARGFIRKPIDIDKFLDAIEGFLS